MDKLGGEKKKNKRKKRATPIREGGGVILPLPLF